MWLAGQGMYGISKMCTELLVLIYIPQSRVAAGTRHIEAVAVWGGSTNNVNKICPKPRAKAYRLGVGESPEFMHGVHC